MARTDRPRNFRNQTLLSSRIPTVSEGDGYSLVDVAVERLSFRRLSLFLFRAYSALKPWKNEI